MIVALAVFALVALVLAAQAAPAVLRKSRTAESEPPPQPQYSGTGALICRSTGRPLISMKPA